jgi:hypothetical protein
MHIGGLKSLFGELSLAGLESLFGQLSLVAIQESRVHLTFRKDSLFVESQEPAKASVVVKLKPNAVLTQQDVLAIQPGRGSGRLRSRP